jgi:hypothetical protein
MEMFLQASIYNYPSRHFGVGGKKLNESSQTLMYSTTWQTEIPFFLCCEGVKKKSKILYNENLVKAEKALSSAARKQQILFSARTIAFSTNEFFLCALLLHADNYMFGWASGRERGDAPPSNKWRGRPL